VCVNIELLKIPKYVWQVTIHWPGIEKNAFKACFVQVLEGLEHADLNVTVL